MKTTLSAWLTAGVSVPRVKLYPHVFSWCYKWHRKSLLFNPTVYICIKNLIRLYVKHSAPPFLTPCAVCHHSQQTSPSQAEHGTLAQTDTNTSTKYGCTKIHTHNECWQPRFYFWLYILSAGIPDTQALTHPYIKNILYVFTPRRTHIQRPSLCWVGKESGVTACCRPVREKSGEGKWEKAEEEQIWSVVCTERSSSTSSFNKD